MADQNNAGRHLAMREAVGMVLRLHGLEDAHAAPRAPGRRLSDSLASDAAPTPDILGLPGGWHVRVTTADRRTWGGAVDSTEQAAALAGDERGAVIAYRRGQPISRAFVVLSLDTFADLLAEREGAAA